MKGPNPVGPSPGFQTEIVLVRHSSSPAQGGTSAAAYAFPGSALSASVSAVYGVGAAVAPLYFPGKLLFSRWIVVWNPNSGTGTSVRLIYADSGPSNITPIATFTASGGAIISTATITATMQSILASTEAAFPASFKFVGHQTLGDGAAGPLIYNSTIEMVWQS